MNDTELYEQNKKELEAAPDGNAYREIVMRAKQREQETLELSDEVRAWQERMEQGFLRLSETLGNLTPEQRLEKNLEKVKAEHPDWDEKQICFEALHRTANSKDFEVR